MIQIRRPLLLLALTALSACGKPATPPADAPAAAPAIAMAPATEAVAPHVVLGETGIRAVTAADENNITFDQPMAMTVSALSAVLGPAGKPTENSECGAGPMTFVAWPGGLTANFQDDKFVGWSVESGSAKGAFVTDKAIGVGSTRAELLAAYPDAKVEESSLGEEFNVGGYDGIFDGKAPTAKVETLWAGTSCVFR